MRRMRTNPDRARVDRADQVRAIAQLPATENPRRWIAWCCECPGFHPPNRQRCKKCRKRRPW